MTYIRTQAFLILGLVQACGPSTRAETNTPTHPGGERHGHAHGHHGQGAAHDFSDVERFAAIFDDPARDAWQKPAEVVDVMELAQGMVVADIGAGTGYFLARLSAAVGSEGHVLGLDTEAAMVAHMQNRIEEAQLANTSAAVVAPDDPGLDPQSVDRVLIVDTWHHISDRASYVSRLHEALRPGGRVVIVDFTMESEHGPPVEMRLPASTVLDELQAGGLSATLITESLPHQYIVVATSPR